MVFIITSTPSVLNAEVSLRGSPNKLHTHWLSSILLYDGLYACRDVQVTAAWVRDVKRGTDGVDYLLHWLLDV